MAQGLLHRAEAGEVGDDAATRHPPEVLFRVGQVIKHKRYGYKGVISGWDPVCAASPQWQYMMRVRVGGAGGGGRWGGGGGGLVSVIFGWGLAEGA